MKPSTFNQDILQPALERVLPIIEIPPSDRASRLMLAIAGQESDWTWRYQLKPGGPNADGAYPARGFWQFEKRGGVVGVMTHRSTTDRAKALCDACHVHWDDDDIWRALEGHDALAAGFARLLLWTDPRPLPDEESLGWRYYINSWRPGKPHPSTWPGCWVASTATIYG
jgi:hypothetical protein